MARPVAGATTEHTGEEGYGKTSSRGDQLTIQRIFKVEGILVSIGFDKTKGRANLRVQGTVFKKG